MKRLRRLYLKGKQLSGKRNEWDSSLCNVSGFLPSYKRLYTREREREKKRERKKEREGEREREREKERENFGHNHRVSEKHDYHRCMKINWHVDPVVPPGNLRSLNFKSTKSHKIYHWNRWCAIFYVLKWWFKDSFTSIIFNIQCSSLANLIARQLYKLVSYEFTLVRLFVCSLVCSLVSSISLQHRHDRLWNFT